MLKTFADFGIEVSIASGETDTLCPQCSASRKKKTAKCLSVNVDKGVWFCNHCGWSGGLKLGADKPKTMHWAKPTYRRPSPFVASELNPKVVSWFASRGIAMPVLERLRVGYAQIYMPQVEDTVNAITFPYYRGEELVNIKYRDGQKNFRMEVGAERVLYGLNDIADITIWVEGEMDKLSLAQVGFNNCVSVPDGAPTPETENYNSKFSFLEADKAAIERIKTHIIAVDNDAPGIRLSEELTRRLGREKCFFVSWPDGCKDANDVLVKLGVEALAECIAQAQPYPIDGVFTALDLSEKINRLYLNGWEIGSPTGWRGLDPYYTVRPGEVTVVTGIPNSGKSSWLDNLIVNLAKGQGWGIAVFSAENQPMEDHMARLIEKASGAPFGLGKQDRLSQAELDVAKDWLGQHFTWILPSDDTDWTLEMILDRARQLVYRKGIRGLVIDPWNELEHLRPIGMTETEYISVSLKRIRVFARRYGVHIWIVAHPAKLYRDKEGNYPVPTMYDISGSAHWRGKADNGICIWRKLGDEHTRVVEVHIQKIRFRQIGKIGMAELIYNSPTGTYHDLANAPREVGFVE